jgi:DNA polymerase-1
VTATGRLSSLNPNLQNIPTRTEEGKKIRGGFVVDDDKVLISADYSQFELRLAAVLSNDSDLINDFNNDIDIHTKTAAEVYGVEMDDVTEEQRRRAKVVNFGILYGMSAKGLSDATGMSIYEAKQFVDHYFELRKPIQNKLKEYLEQAKTMGYVETYFGRRRPTPDIRSSNFVVRMGAERAAQNMPIQGTEADLMKLAMIRLDNRLPKGAEMIMQVHDSIMVECDPKVANEAKAVLKDVMENVAPELKVKLAVEIKEGRRWSEV